MGASGGTTWGTGTIFVGEHATRFFSWGTLRPGDVPWSPAILSSEWFLGWAGVGGGSSTLRTWEYPGRKEQLAHMSQGPCKPICRDAAGLRRSDMAGSLAQRGVDGWPQCEAEPPTARPPPTVHRPQCSVIAGWWHAQRWPSCSLSMTSRVSPLTSHLSPLTPQQDIHPASGPFLFSFPSLPRADTAKRQAVTGRYSYYLS